MMTALAIVLVALVALVGWRLYRLPAALAARGLSSQAQALGGISPALDPTKTPGTYEYAIATWGGPGTLPAPLDVAVMQSFTQSTSTQVVVVGDQAWGVCDNCPSGHHGAPCIYCGTSP
jgi:hypothetical protein